jgi:hypothetical protein
MGYFKGRWTITALVAIACTANCGGDEASDTGPTRDEHGGDAGKPGAEAGRVSTELGGAGSGGLAQTDGGAAGEGTVAGRAAGEGAVGGAAGEGAVGGAAGEGAVAGGASGAPASLPPVQLPAGCAIQSERTLNGGANGGCAITVDCSGVPNLEIVCWDQGDASWSCSETQREDELDLTGLAGPDVCRFAGDVFATGVNVLFTSDETCVPELRSNAAGLCEMRDRCQLTADFGSGVEGTLTWTKGVRCSGSPAMCECSNGEMYRVEGFESAAVCERGYDLCEGRTPSPEGPTECSNASSETSIGVNECWTSSMCTTTTEVEAGITHLHRFHREIICQAIGLRDDEGSNCHCGADIGRFYFESALLVEDDSVRTCERFHSLCVQPDAFDFQGPNVCDAMAVSVNEPYGCVIQRNCRRPAVLDGESVVAMTGATLRCRPEGNSFHCECDDLFDEAFLVEAPSFAEACTVALAECPEPAFIRPRL